MEIDITQTISGPSLPAFSDFYLPCHQNKNRAAVVFFPSNMDSNFSFSGEDFSKRMYYMSMEYNIFGKRVRDLSHAIQIMAEISETFSIEHIELGGHGTPYSIQWSLERIEVGKSDDSLKLLFSMMSSNGTVLTLSCQNGKSVGDENMIDYLARIGRGHRIIGTSCNNSSALNLKVTSPYPLQLKYTTSYGGDVTVIRQFN